MSNFLSRIFRKKTLVDHACNLLSQLPPHIQLQICEIIMDLYAHEAQQEEEEKLA